MGRASDACAVVGRIALMATEPKITLGEMRTSGVRGLLI